MTDAQKIEKLGLITAGDGDTLKNTNGNWEKWDLLSGQNVLGFIKKRLADAITKIEYDSGEKKIKGYNTFDELKSETEISIVPPTYQIKDFLIVGLRANGIDIPKNANHPYDSTASYELGIRLVVGYDSETWHDLNNQYEVDLSLSSNSSIYTDIFVLTSKDSIKDEVVWVALPYEKFLEDASSRDLSTFTFKATVKVPITTNTGVETLTRSITSSTYKLIKLELSYSSNTYILKDNKVKFKVTGIAAGGNYILKYVMPTILELNSDANNLIPIDGNSVGSSGDVDITLPSPGVYEVFARIEDIDSNKIVSNWVQVNVIAEKGYEGAPLSIAYDIKNQIDNCDTAALYKVAVSPGIGGNTAILSYLGTSPLTLFLDSNLFKSVEYSNLLKEDTISDTSFYSYNEFDNLGESGANRLLGIKLTIGGLEYQLKNLLYNISSGRVTVSNYFSFKIVLNEYNLNGELLYVKDSFLVHNFNLAIVLNNNIFDFSKFDDNFSTEDGYNNELKTTSFKVSALYDNYDLGVFKNSGGIDNRIDLSDLINSSGFTLEFLYKTAHTNGEEAVFSIGNILFGPGYCRIFLSEADKLEEAGTWVNSKASFGREDITHVLLTYLTDYRPNTYEKSVYSDLFPGYKDLNAKYNILRIFINGTINREILIEKNVLMKDNSFKLQIHPISSDVEFYTIRTYTKALNYSEILKNRISAFTDISDKIKYYQVNDIISNLTENSGEISFYKAYLNNNVAVIVLPDGTNPDYPEENPLWFGNKNTDGSGETIGNINYKKKNRTILIHYKKAFDKKDEYYSKYSGRYTGFEYKALGSSAKKYMLAHNVLASKGNWSSLQQIDTYMEELKTNAEAELSSAKVVPLPDGSLPKKLVGKVNTASSMLSHKMGAVELFTKAYETIYPDATHTPGASSKLGINGKTRKSVHLDLFLYFYVKVPDPSKVYSCKDLFTQDERTGIIYDLNVHFFGFWTWGSGKADKPVFGYGDDTPEYILIEGADNNSPGANFKLPWSSFLCWDTSKDFSRNDKTSETFLLTEKYTSRIYNGSENPNYDPFKNLLINDETIKFELGTDPWDIDLGCEQVGDTKVYEIPENTKNSFRKWIEFYDYIYEYDFTSLKPWNANKFYEAGVTKELATKAKPEQNIKYRYYINTTDCQFVNKDSTTANIPAMDVFRWDARLSKWVPAGLHVDEGTKKWKTYNLNLIKSELLKSPMFSNLTSEKLSNCRSLLINELYSLQEVENYLIPVLKELFILTVEEYVDVNDLAYHQAFCKIVSGTDNRAKNTYITIFGKRYSNYTLIDENTRHNGYKLPPIEGYLDGVIGYTISKKLEDGTWVEDKDYLYIEGGSSYLTIDLTAPVRKATKNAETGEYTYTTVQDAKTLLDNKDYYPYKTDVGDYKIRFFLDDVDTIFETDNNGQQVKPYYLLEPAFNLDTEDYWGDRHSSLFYPFDICFEEKVETNVRAILNYLTEGATSIADQNSNMYKLFFAILNNYPPICYNHTAEIYYEVPELFFTDGHETSAANLYSSLLKDFGNNSVPTPLSLSHGSCYESEILFMTDRLIMLGSSTLAANKIRNTVSMSGKGSGGSSTDFQLKGKAKFINYFAPTWLENGSGTDTYLHLLSIKNSLSEDVDYVTKEDRPINYDPIIDLFVELGNTLKYIVKPNYEKPYNLESISLDRLLTHFLYNPEYYKEVEITEGLNAAGSFVPFINASKIVIDGSTLAFSIAGSVTKIEMKLYYPVAETLILNNIVFNSSRATLDFRGCTKLTTLDLSGCVGISTIIIPGNRKLSKLILPEGVTTLSLGYTPSLTIENFKGGNNTFTSLTIDAGKNDLMLHILQNYISTNADSLVINNTKNVKVWINSDSLKAVCHFNYAQYLGKLYIGSSLKCVDSKGNYLPNDSSSIAISYSEKHKLVQLFGNIDDEKSTTVVYYKKTTISAKKVLIAQETRINASGIPVYNLTIPGNDIGIESYKEGNKTKYRLKIVYNLLTSTSNTTCDLYSGRLTFSEDERLNEFNVSVTIYTSTGSPIVAVSSTNSNQEYCIVKFGFNAPNEGDFAYSDGTFSLYYKPNTNDSKLIGFVYYVNEILADLEYEVRVMSVEASSTNMPLGPVKAGAPIDYGDTQTKQRREKISSFITTDLGIDANSEAYNRVYTPKTLTSIPSGTIVYKTGATIPSPFYSGKMVTDAYVELANSVVNKLNMPSINSTNYIDMIDALNLYESSTKDSGVRFSDLIYPAYLYAKYYKPTTNPLYTSSSWYIPSSREMEWIIQNIVNSCSQTADSSKYNWKETSKFDTTKDAIFAKMEKAVKKVDSSASIKDLFAILGERPKLSSDTSLVNYAVRYDKARYRDEDVTPQWYTESNGWNYYNTSNYGIKDASDWVVIPCITLTYRNANA